MACKSAQYIKEDADENTFYFYFCFLQPELSLVINCEMKAKICGLV